MNLDKKYVDEEFLKLSQSIDNGKESEYSIHFIQRKTEKKQHSYIVLKSTRDKEVAKTIKRDVETYTHKIANRESRVHYFEMLDMPRGQLQYIEWANVPHGKEIVNMCNSVSSDDISELSSVAALMSDLWGYIIAIRQKEQSIYLFKKYTSSELFNVAKSRFGIGDVFRNKTPKPGVVSLNRGDTVEFEKNYDAAVLIRNKTPLEHLTTDILNRVGIDKKDTENAVLFVSRRFNFENFFSYKDYYPEFIDNNIDEFKKVNLIDDIEKFSSRCKSSYAKSIRLSKILNRRKYEEMPIKKIKSYVKKHKLNISFKNNQMVYDSKHIDDILDVLDEFYYISEITNTQRKVTNAQDVTD